MIVSREHRVLISIASCQASTAKRRVWMPKKISELQSAELRFRALLNKRDEINEQAAVLRSERDSLHERKMTLQDQMNEARNKRDAFVAEMRVHKHRRDELQAKA